MNSLDRVSVPAPNDLDSFWMPFTPNRQFRERPRLIVGAEGMHYTDIDGRQVLDGAAGLWCVNAGHGRRQIADAIARQAVELDYVPSFQFSHPQAFTLAARLASLAPAGLGKVHFVNSGSEAVDTALKIALAYHKLKGEGGRVRLIGRERGYHGVGFGGISVGGIVSNRKAYGTMLAGVDHLRQTYERAEQAFSSGEPAWGAHLADELERLVALHDASTIAAVIVEPVAGSGGVIAPPKGYLARLREICTRHGMLLIFDEVITGFGRTGYAFAAERFGVVPDIITFAKGVTNGAAPLGGVLVSNAIFEAFAQPHAHQIELFHGYTWAAHPIACAAALAALDIYRDEGLFERARALEPVFAEAVMSLRDAPHVADIRTIGLMAGIDLAPRDGFPGARGHEALRHAFHDQAMMMRISGDTLALSPALVITEDQIVDLVGRVRRVLEALH